MDVGAGGLYSSALLGATATARSLAVTRGPCCLAGSVCLGTEASTDRGLLGLVFLHPLLVLAGVSHTELEVAGNHGRAATSRTLVSAVRTVVRFLEGNLRTAPLAGLGSGNAPRAVLVPVWNDSAASSLAGVHTVIAETRPVLQPHLVGALDLGFGVPAVAALPGRPLADSDRLDRGRLGHGGGRDVEGRRSRGLQLVDGRHDQGSRGLLRRRFRGVNHGAGGRGNRELELRAGLVDEAVQERGDAGGERTECGRDHVAEHDVLLEVEVAG